MKNTHTLESNLDTNLLPEETTTQLNVRPLHIIGTAMLLLDWACLGTVLIH